MLVIKSVHIQVVAHSLIYWLPGRSSWQQRAMYIQYKPKPV